MPRWKRASTMSGGSPARSKQRRRLFVELVNPVASDELVPIWSRPGWTTPAEFRLVAKSLKSMVGPTEHLVEMKKTLIEGSQLVGVRNEIRPMGPGNGVPGNELG